jgi:hypothetical protein
MKSLGKLSPKAIEAIKKENLVALIRTTTGEVWVEADKVERARNLIKDFKVAPKG